MHCAVVCFPHTPQNAPAYVLNRLCCANSRHPRRIPRCDRERRVDRARQAGRTLTPGIDRLERRALLSSGPLVAHPTFEVGSFGSGGPPAGAFTPAQIEQGYGFNQITFGSVAGNGSGETIAIVDAYDDPNIQSDLNTFDTEFGLPSPTVNKVNQTGGTTYPVGGFDRGMGARGIAGRRVGARDRARGQHHAGRGQFRQ